MSNIQALMLARSRPLNLKNGDVDKYLTLLEGILQQFQNQTGTDQTEVKGIPDVYGVIGSGFGYADALSGAALEYVSTSIGYTTSGNEFVRCTSPLTVTLNLTPSDGERVFVQVYGGYFQVTIAGNVNGSATTIVHGQGDCVNLVYSLEFGEWVVE
jgi:hypothetical protein